MCYRDLEKVKCKPFEAIVKKEPDIDFTNPPDVKMWSVMEGDKDVFEILDLDDEMIVPENVDVDGFSSDASDLGSDGAYNFEDDNGEIEEEEAAPLATD